MMDKISALIFNIERSQAAYNLYLSKKNYLEALRIYKANRRIYDILVDNEGLWTVEIKSLIFQYIFHLEDWMEQFALMEAEAPGLTSPFIFHRIEGSPSFPKTIIDELQKLIQ